MPTVDALVRWLHTLAGVVTLISMVVPLVARKGGKVHRRAGWVFVGCMVVLCESSAWMCVAALFGASGESVTGRGIMSREFGAFLLFVTLLTGNCVSSGVRVLRRKKPTEPVGLSVDLVFASVVGLCAGGLGVWGLVEGNVLFMGFAVLGVLGAGRELRMLRGVPTDKRYWWYVHMNGMMGGCIGTVTAFLVINSEQLFAPSSIGVPGWVFWLGPAALGVPAGIVWRRYYRRKFTRAGA